MRQLVVILCAAVALGGLAAQPVDARDQRTASESTKVQAVLLQEVALFNRMRWRAAWRLYAPRVRSRCSYDRFVARMTPVIRATGRVTLRNLTVRVTGRRAIARYRIVAGGKVVGGTTTRSPDVFTRVGDRWFDDFDSDGLCPSGGAR